MGSALYGDPAAPRAVSETTQLARTDVLRIRKIRIHNYARIPDLHLEIRGHAVIVGANNAGKSSLLRLLDLTLAGTTAELYQQLSLADLADPSQPLSCYIELDSLTRAERDVFCACTAYLEEYKSHVLAVSLYVRKDDIDPETIRVERSLPLADRFEGGNSSPTVKQMAAFGWRYLPASRSTSANAMEGSASALQTLLRAINLGPEKEELAALLGGFNKQLNDSEHLSKLRAAIAAHLSRAMPQPIGKDGLALRTAADPEAEVLANVRMFFNRNGDHVPLTDQSDGLRQLIAMTLFDMAEGAASIIAIDEPEMHLHPSSQRTIADLFARSARQSLLATHSAHIVQRFEPTQVIAISPDGACHQISASVSDVEKVRINWWSPRLLEALTASFVIVVEGVSDRVIIEATAAAMGISLDRCGALVFELDGADKFRHVHKLLGPDGFGVPILGLVDEAEKGSWLSAFGGRGALGTSLWVCSPDLEAEYCQGLSAQVVAQALITMGVCRPEGLLQACGATKIADLRPDDVAEFCRTRKVMAAAAAATAITARTALPLSNVSALLTRLQIAAS